MFIAGICENSVLSCRNKDSKSFGSVDFGFGFVLGFYALLFYSIFSGRVALRLISCYRGEDGGFERGSVF